MSDVEGQRALINLAKLVPKHPLYAGKLKEALLKFFEPRGGLSESRFEFEARFADAKEIEKFGGCVVDLCRFVNSKKDYVDREVNYENTREIWKLEKIVQSVVAISTNSNYNDGNEFSASFLTKLLRLCFANEDSNDTFAFRMGDEEFNEALLDHHEQLWEPELTDVRVIFVCVC